jgi:hypothetical protein
MVRARTVARLGAGIACGLLVASTLAAPGLETRRALEISGLDRHFAVHDSLDEALSASL